MKTDTAFGPRQYAIIACASLVGLIHISLLFPNPLFILNGIGTILLLAALYAPISILASYRGIVRWIFIAYTALTALLWAFWGARTPLAYVTLFAEIVLIGLLWLDGQRTSG